MGKIHVASVRDLRQPIERKKGTRYEARHYQIGGAMGSKKVGFNVTELAPGKTAFPFHFHHRNEEVFLVLEGEGTLRSPEGKNKIKEGDLVFCPTGPEGAHQIVNTGKGVLKYLAISSMLDPEVAEYPDTGKYAVTLGRPPDGNPDKAVFRAVAYRKDMKDYWDGEDVG